MDQKKSPNRRSKRQSKLAEDCYWDCSVCTYRNTAEAFKCLMCDIRKGTSTRKPRINPQLVAQQVAQQYTQSIPKVRKEGSPVSRTEIGMMVGPTLPTLPPPPLPIPTSIPAPVLPPKQEQRAEKRNGAPCEGRTSSRKASSIHIVICLLFCIFFWRCLTSRRPKLKNVDRSSAEHKAVTVNNVTVIITEFQPKRHQSSSSSSEHNHCLPPSGNRHGHGPPHAAVNGCSSGVVENGNHSDSAPNLNTDSHSDGRSS